MISMTMPELRREECCAWLLWMAWGKGRRLSAIISQRFIISQRLTIPTLYLLRHSWFAEVSFTKNKKLNVAQNPLPYFMAGSIWFKGSQVSVQDLVQDSHHPYFWHSLRGTFEQFLLIHTFGTCLFSWIYTCWISTKWNHFVKVKAWYELSKF